MKTSARRPFWHVLLVLALFCCTAPAPSTPLWTVTDASRVTFDDLRADALEAPPLDPEAERTLRDVSGLDAHALSVPFDLSEGLETVVAELVRPAETEAERAWVLVRWIAEHVAYDVEAADAGTIEYREQQPGEVLRTRKAVCAGYARLFYDMATLAGLDVKYITGEVRPSGEGHAWNAVRLGGRWHLLDATWAAGRVSDDRQFVKRFDDRWFMTDPVLFALRHTPDDPDWALTGPETNLRTVAETFAHEWETLDAHALAAPDSAEASLGALVAYLAAPTHNEAEAARVIFRWIADRIVFDAAASAREMRGRPLGRAVHVRRALAERRTTALGMALLFDEMASRAGLRGLAVPGYVAQGGASLRDARPSDLIIHVWNIVEIDGRRQAIDLPAALGYGPARHHPTPRVDGRWFLPNPTTFTQTHDPASASLRL